MTLHCHTCGAPNAPYWYRRPGRFTDLPSAQRGQYRRSCAACIEETEGAWVAKFGHRSPDFNLKNPLPPSLQTPNNTPEE